MTKFRHINAVKFSQMQYRIKATIIINITIVPVVLQCLLVSQHTLLGSKSNRHIWIVICPSAGPTKRVVFTHPNFFSLKGEDRPGIYKHQSKSDYNPLFCNFSREVSSTWSREGWMTECTGFAPTHWNTRNTLLQLQRRCRKQRQGQCKRTKW